jgi:hypothetical protein
VEKGAMVLAAVEAVAKAHPVWAARGRNPDASTQAAARETVHAAPPSRSSSRIFTTDSKVVAIACLEHAVGKLNRFVP